MCLAVTLGLLADFTDEDPEGAEWLLGEIKELNLILAKYNLPAHLEPTVIPELDNRSLIDSYPYSFLHYLRRVAACQIEDPNFKASPLPEGVDPGDDPAIETQLDLQQSHLICHSDCEGYYVPVDFEEVIVDSESDLSGGAIVGSSVRLLAELETIATALEINIVNGQLSEAEVAKISEEMDSESGLWKEKIVWLNLYEAARLSVQHKLLMSFN